MEVVGGIPIECLTAGELSGVWSGWSNMGDREVVREASAKGTYLKLAHKFLAYRTGWTIGEAQKYFYSEADIWINELLNKRQVHRAGHILKNVGKEPIAYICNICVKSNNAELRDYLATYIANNNGFTDQQIEAWQVVNCIKNYKEKYSLNNKSLENVSIDEILNLSPNIKDPLFTEIYFHIYEPFLSDKLKNKVVWEYLLLDERDELLIGWIDIKYSDNEHNIIVDGNDITEVFKNLEITEDMIDKIDESNASEPLREVVLNHLAHYGLFMKKEQEDVKLVLSRFMSAMIVPSKFNSILSKKSCNLNADNFTSKIHSILYYQTVNEDKINRELYLKDKKLLDLLRSMQENDEINQEIFNRAVCQTIHHISNDFNKYLEDNPLITLYLVLSKCKDISMRKDESNSMVTSSAFNDIIHDKNGFKIGEFTINSEAIEKMKNLRYIKDAIDPTSQRDDITMYQLLHGFKNLDVHKLFKWRENNDEIPNFASEKLIKKYGREEKLTYKYYLKEARPSMAAYVLQNSRGKMQNSLSTRMKSRIAFNAHIFGLKHVNNLQIINTCITFIEFLGVDSEYLRFHTTAANYIQNQLNIPINDLLESITYYHNPKDLVTVMRHLEHSFYNEFTTPSMNDVANFVSSLKSWHFILRFATIHNTALPVTFLEYFAMNNLWFEFVLTAHIFEYPLKQILECAARFKNKNIREHLLIALTNSQLPGLNCPLNSDEKLTSHDGKQFILSRMSLKSNSTYNVPGPPSDSTLDTNDVVDAVANPPEYFPLNQTTPPFTHDLWLTILKCHQSQDPPSALLKLSCENKSPILIVLAACYEPSSTPAFCYSWLVISTENKELIEDYTECLNDQVWPAIKVSNLFRKMISLGFVDTVKSGLEIFMPDNPLYEFFKFLVQYIKHHDYELSEKSLVNFTNLCASLKRNEMIDWNDIETTYLSNEYWIATVAIECVLTAVGTCLDSTHLQIKFLKMLMEYDFNSAMNICGPDFAVLLKIVESLATTNTKINFAAMKLSANECNVTDEIHKCIQKLIENEDFNGALELSSIAKLPCSKIILDQYRSEFTRNINNNVKIDITFWKKCAFDIEKYNVEFEDAAGFFIEHAERLVLYKERYEILQLALKTLKPISTDQQTIDTVEMAMWKSCILAGSQAIEITNEKKIFNKLRTELLSGVSNLRVSCILNSEAEQKAVDALIGRFIDDEDLETALRLSTIFNYKHNDLKILMLCLSIAEGGISPYDLNSYHKVLLLEPVTGKQQKSLALENRGRTRRHSESSLNSFNSPLPVESNVNGNDVTDKVISSPALQNIQTDSINMLEKLVYNLQHGINVGKKILLLYKLSIYLKRSYQSLLTSRDPIEMLYEITRIKIPGVDVFILFNYAIGAYQISNTDLAKFLVSEWLLHITRQVENDIHSDFFHSSDNSRNCILHAVADFSADASVLGWEFLKNANLRSGHSHGIKRDLSALKIIVELLILAHYYFTASCSMEGIASVLRTCQNLVNTLQHAKLWNLLVRLVTGIGRFTEMNYVFQILKENDQFEYLLKKKVDNFAGLKNALLEFCKKQCPDNKELFNLVALHFQLYNEIAITWESEAKIIIRELIKETRRDTVKSPNSPAAIKFIKNDKTEKKLQLAMDNFTHATEYYLKDNKLNLANRCSCQAQLVALQLSLFNNATPNHEVMNVLNMTIEEINKAMCQSLALPQSLILVRAYNHNADWSNVLYHHVIVDGQLQYLKDFLTYKRLTPAIVQDCACRYRMEKNLTKQMTINMEYLISELNDVECKYVLASQLGFKNIIEAMISNATVGAYLRDTIWKQGFHPQEFIGENFRG